MVDVLEIERKLRGWAEALPHELAAAEAANLDDAKATAVRLSSGTLTPPMLRQMGHPYRRGGPGPALPINVQTGMFRSSWETEGPAGTVDGLSGALTNTDPKAPLLFGGTARMMARPILEAVEAEIGARIEERRERALERIMERFFG